MRPHELYEKPIFDALAEHGFEHASFNDMTRGTARYEVGTFDSESKVREHVPGVFVHLLRRKLRPWNGVVPLKLDWFVARGLRACRDGELTEPDGRESRAPDVLERPRFQGEILSDHDPVVVDVLP